MVAPQASSGAIRSPKTAELVAQTLRKMIVDGQLTDGAATVVDCVGSEASLAQALQVGGGVQRLDGDARERRERRVALRRERVGLAPLRLGPGNGIGRSHTESRTSSYLGEAKA